MKKQDPGFSFSETITSLQKQIKELQRKNSQLEKIAAQAESANKAKTDFLAMISHEIRTPMNAVMGMSQLLLNTGLQDKQLQYVQLINASAQSLMILVNNLLDFSRIEANKMTLYQEPFHLEEEINQLVAIHALTGQEKMVRVLSEIDPSIRHKQYLGDVHRLRQVLINLLGNALKFTEKGEVLLRVFPEDDLGGDKLRFEVRDTGIGIAEKDIAALFQPFSQVDSSSTRRYGGPGLGLSICARLVQLMGGEIGVHSLPGKGTTFWFTIRLKCLPQQKAADKALSESEEDNATAAGKEAAQSASVLPVLGAEQAQPLADASATAVRAAVLVVDDEAVNRILVQEVLQYSPFEVECANSGAEALAAWRRRDFALILMDCQMPEMDGYSTTRTMLAEARQQQRKMPVIIALTADGTSLAKSKSREAGMVDYLVKPLDFERLHQVLATWAAGSLDLYPGQGSLFRRDAVLAQTAIGQAVNTQVLERLRNDIGNIQAVVQVFLASLENRSQELAVACKNGDAASMVRIAHTLKGSSAQFGAEELSSLCQQVERLARMGHVEQIGALLQKAEEAIGKVQEYFSENVQA